MKYGLSEIVSNLYSVLIGRNFTFEFDWETRKANKLHKPGTCVNPLLPLGYKLIIYHKCRELEQITMVTVEFVLCDRIPPGRGVLDTTLCDNVCQ